MNDWFELLMLAGLLAQLLERLDIEYIAIKRTKK